MSKKTMRSKASILTAIANHRKSAYRPQEHFARQQIGQAASPAIQTSNPAIQT